MKNNFGEFPSGWRTVWLLVMFDLPIFIKEQRKVSSRYRNILLKDGFFCVEIDSDQVNTVSNLFIGQNISLTGIYRDLSERNRCVVFHNRKNNLKNKIKILKSEFPSCENSY